jgi:hypothetical protein
MASSSAHGVIKCSWCHQVLMASSSAHGVIKCRRASSSVAGRHQMLMASLSAHGVIKCRRVCSMKGWKDEQKWLQAARALEFNPEQQRKVLLFREQSLQHLQECARSFAAPLNCSTTPTEQGIVALRQYLLPDVTSHLNSNCSHSY